MSKQRLRHDVAMATTTKAMESFRWSDSQEYREAFNALFPVIEAGLAAFEEYSKRQTHRLKPHTKETANGPPEE